MNEAIARMRHSATRSLLERDDVIIVASGSVLYGHRLGRDLFGDGVFVEQTAPAADHAEIIRSWSRAIQAQRPGRLRAGNFRRARRQLEIFPSHYEDTAWGIAFFGDEVEEIVSSTR